MLRYNKFAYTQGSIVTGLQNCFKEFRRERKIIKEGGLAESAAKENQPPNSTQAKKRNSLKQRAPSLV